MSEILGLEHFSLRPDGPTLTLSVGLGQSVSVVGPAGAGKSHLLRVLAGFEKPAQGSVEIRGQVTLAGQTPLPRRTKVQSLGRRLKGSTQRLTEVLTATRLWDVRQKVVGDLSPSQQAACDLVEALMGDGELVILDGQLDMLDPWALKSVLDMMRHQMTHRERTFAIATHRPDLVKEFDAVIVLRDERVRFAGTVADLIRTGPPHVLDIATENQPAVRALIAPFEVRVQPTEDGLRLEAPEGQEIAAKLLLDGYGDVKYVVVRTPTIEEALRAL